MNLNNFDDVKDLVMAVTSKLSFQTYKEIKEKKAPIQLPFLVLPEHIKSCSFLLLLPHGTDIDFARHLLNPTTGKVLYYRKFQAGEGYLYITDNTKIYDGEKIFQLNDFLFKLLSDLLLSTKRI